LSIWYFPYVFYGLPERLLFLPLDLFKLRGLHAVTDEMRERGAGLDAFVPAHVADEQDPVLRPHAREEIVDPLRAGEAALIEH
jgi:hypothetical protein